MASPPATTSSNSISRRFDALKKSSRRALVCYVTAGHPDRERSLATLHALEEGGADIIELGVPFSDPIADGPIIQASSQKALENGMSYDGVIDLVAAASLGSPVVLFSYLNPILAAGPDALARAAEAGAAGILVTDIPVGADPEREEWLGSSPLAFIRLVAPTTPRERMAEIARHGSGFVYLISRLGVTGVREQTDSSLPETVRRLRSATTLPICVGFGISTPAQARAVGEIADGVVVGSALVKAAEAGPEEVLKLTRSLREALDGKL
ncbi:MAG TPA: tryptophan synthase subunit alpha [Gemmatimonadaceae bacterium]|jgi:tryptophan synthase alpha chain|nr:tryptophan synthase subunit alpha [Gemmatimonadaceae bacterium]